jgi:malate dehydrogenase
MSLAVILGAGHLGAAIAHKLAERESFREIRLIDAHASVAAGKALDLRQTGPIARFDTKLSGTDDVLAAVGADVVIVADQVDGDEWRDDAGLVLLRRLVSAGAVGPFVFAGPRQFWLMEKASAELRVPGDRIVGTAASALVGRAAALVALELNGSAADVQLAVAGRPPACVVGWSSATVGGSLITGRVAAHRLLAISDALRQLWPPGPQAIGAATAPVAEALAGRSRRVHHATTILDGEFGARGVAAMLPLTLGQGRVLGRHLPSFSPQELTAVGSGLV